MGKLIKLKHFNVRGFYSIRSIFRPRRRANLEQLKLVDRGMLEKWVGMDKLATLQCLDMAGSSL